jgi:hypothetical protein
MSPEDCLFECRRVCSSSRLERVGDGESGRESYSRYEHINSSKCDAKRSKSPMIPPTLSFSRPTAKLNTVPWEKPPKTTLPGATSFASSSMIFFTFSLASSRPLTSPIGVSFPVHSDRIPSARSGSHHAGSSASPGCPAMGT